jgi:chaperone modulatory protein CbpM
MKEMRSDNLIAINDFCINHNLEISFISSLQLNGLIEIKTIKDTRFIEASELRNLEKIVHFFYELDINIEGIETITHLLQRINYMQDEIISLKNKLRLYESE